MRETGSSWVGIASVGSIGASVLMGLVVSFSGQIGSGKSSISSALAKTLGWPRVSFGDYLRAEVKRRGGNPNSRHMLQKLGQVLVDTHPESFSQSVLDMADFMPGGDLILDGIRHVEVQTIISRLVVPSEAKLIHLSADVSTRLERVAARPDGQSDFTRTDRHQVEEELRNRLPTFADAVVDARADVEITCRKCLNLIRTWSRS